MRSFITKCKKFFIKPIKATGFIVYYVCVGHCILEYLGDFIVCQGPSMEPTLFSNDVVIGEHISVIRRKVKKGDIVVCRSPNDPLIFVCKRIRAGPGEKIGRGLLSQVVPLGHVWLEGDNKDYSTDSRTYGPVPIGLIRSRVMYRVFPFSKVGFLDRR